MLPALPLVLDALLLIKEQQPALCSVLLKSKDKAVRSLFPDGPEWNLLEDLVAILEPFEEATKALSGSNYPTISMVSLLLYQVCKVTLKVNEDDNVNLKRIKETMLEDFQDRYSSPAITEILNIAAFLDPRFKGLDPFIPVNERVDVKERVKLQLLMFAPATTEHSDRELREATTSSSVTTNITDTVVTTDDGETAPTAKKAKSGPIASLFSGMSWPNRKQLSGIEAVESELRRYQDEETIDLDSDPLAWWNSRMCQYPLLAQLVRMVWSLPATSVCSEQVFSAAGNVLTKKRARLLPENVDKLVFLHQNSENM